MAAGPDTVFTVAAYPVDARAENAVAAKERAMADGQQAAFRSLLKRLVPVTAYDRLKRLKGAKAADLVDGVAIRSEQNSSTEYIASLDFSFRAEGVRGMLRREGIPFIDTQAAGIVVVPALRDGEGVKASAEWTAVWQGLDLKHTLTPVKLERLRPEIHPDTLKMAMDGTGGAERILAGEYKSEEVVLAIAEVDAPARRLVVTMTGRDAVGSFHWKRSYRMAPGDTAYTMELAAVVGLGVLEGRWKAVQAASRGGVDTIAGPGEEVLIHAEFSSLSEWTDIRGRLLETSGVDDVRIDGVSARAADITLRYPGGAQRLGAALAAKGLALVDDGGAWVLRSRF